MTRKEYEKKRAGLVDKQNHEPNYIKRLQIAQKVKELDDTYFSSNINLKGEYANMSEEDKYDINCKMTRVILFGDCMSEALVNYQDAMKRVIPDYSHSTLEYKVQKAREAVHEIIRFVDDYNDETILDGFADICDNFMFTAMNFIHKSEIIRKPKH